MYETPGAGATGPVRLYWQRLLGGPGGERRALLYEELASQLQAGIGLRSAVGHLYDQPPRGTRPISTVWKASVDAGDPLWEGMRLHPGLFLPLEVAMLRIGERSGRMVAALRGLAIRLDTAHKARRAVLAAIAYPLLVIHVALCLPTIPLVLVPRGFPTYALLVTVGLLVIWGVPLLLASFYAARRDDPTWSRRLCRLPIVGAAVHAAAVHRFAWTLGTLHDAGETSDVALEEAARAADVGWFRARLDGAVRQVAEGHPLSESVRFLEAVPRDVCQMIETGERSGSLAEAMERAGSLYEERAARAARSAAVAAGGVLFALAVLVVLVAVGGVFARVYGPLFEML